MNAESWVSNEPNLRDRVSFRGASEGENELDGRELVRHRRERNEAWSERRVVVVRAERLGEDNGERELVADIRRETDGTRERDRGAVIRRSERIEKVGRRRLGQKVVRQAVARQQRRWRRRALTRVPKSRRA